MLKMTDKELRKLHKYELIELLYNIRKELDEATAENKVLKEQLAEKTESADELMDLVRETAENVRSLCGIDSIENAVKRSGEDL